jgi:low affinity Fe/Cu permease
MNELLLLIYIFFDYLFCQKISSITGNHTLLMPHTWCILQVAGTLFGRVLQFSHGYQMTTANPNKLELMQMVVVTC